MVEECVRPKLDIQIRTNQQGTDMITDNAVSAFNRAVLMRGIGACRMNFISMFCKDIDNIRVRIKFATLIHKNIFIT